MRANPPQPMQQDPDLIITLRRFGGNTLTNQSMFTTNISSPSSVNTKNHALHESFQGSDPGIEEYSYWNSKPTMTSSS